MEQQQQDQELHQQNVESDDDDDGEEQEDDDGIEEEEEDDDHLVMEDAMERACQGGHMETIASLLDAGTNVNCIDEGGHTPIMVALHSGQLLAAIMLAGRGADLSRITNDGVNVLHLAACGGDCECIE
jgi:ankyrin repeat protein